jgi:predicted outer membrane repeat protein
MRSRNTHPTRLILFLVTTIFLIFTCGIAFGATWYVDVAGSGSGTSWKDAGTLQGAIDAATDGDEIWIKAGLYALAATINVDKAVALYGGFAGHESKKDKRDSEINVTTIDGQNMVLCFYVTADAIFDGLVITRGYVDGYSDYPWCGGGICSIGDPTIANCSFIGNSAGIDGGGIHSLGNATITNCSFIGNRGSRGGGIYSIGDSTIIDCSFSGNYSDSQGGGIFSRGNATITDCSFIGNEGSDGGGGIMSYDKATITNCSFIGNSAVFELGGGINSSGNVTIAGCSFSGNWAWYGGGIGSYGDATIASCSLSGNWAWYSGGGIGFWAGNATATITNSSLSGNWAYWTGGGGITFFGVEDATITNSILWGNDSWAEGEEPQIYDPSFSSTVAYSNIDQDGYEGSNGNIRQDPLFVDPGYWDDNGTPEIWWDDIWVDGDYHLTLGSPCIDAGTETAPALPLFDFEGDPRIFAGLPPDMGADEFFMDIVIDIKPDGNPNSININSNAKVPVAIFSDEGFYAPDVNPATVVAEPVRIVEEYVDDDNELDLVLHFNAQDLELDADSTQATLFAATYDGMPIKGTDGVNITSNEN